MEYLKRILNTIQCASAQLLVFTYRESSTPNNDGNVARISLPISFAEWSLVKVISFIFPSFCNVSFSFLVGTADIFPSRNTKGLLKALLLCAGETVSSFISKVVRRRKLTVSHAYLKYDMPDKRAFTDHCIVTKCSDLLTCATHFNCRYASCAFFKWREKLNPTSGFIVRNSNHKNWRPKTNDIKSIRIKRESLVIERVDVYLGGTARGMSLRLPFWNKPDVIFPEHYW